MSGNLEKYSLASVVINLNQVAKILISISSSHLVGTRIHTTLKKCENVHFYFLTHKHYVIKLELQNL